MAFSHLPHDKHRDKHCCKEHVSFSKNLLYNLTFSPSKLINRKKTKSESNKQINENKRQTPKQSTFLKTNTNTKINQ